MKYTIETSTRFKRDYKLMKKRGCNMKLLKEAIEILASDEQLPEKYLDHSLMGEYKGMRECHIEPDWLLVYRKEKERLLLALARTGTHSDLF